MLVVRGDRAGGGVMDKTSDWGKSTLFKRRGDISIQDSRFWVVREYAPLPFAILTQKDQHICLYLDPGTRYCVIRYLLHE